MPRINTKVMVIYGYMLIPGSLSDPMLNLLIIAELGDKIRYNISFIRRDVSNIVHKRTYLAVISSSQLVGQVRPQTAWTAGNIHWELCSERENTWWFGAILWQWKQDRYRELVGYMISYMYKNPGKQFLSFKIYLQSQRGHWKSKYMYCTCQWINIS
jgi:hypothetical protein